MNIKRILLTGDDGYNGIGTRVLASILKDQYDVTIIATYTQQSGIGGALDLKYTKEWGEVETDGVKSIWVKGSPSDAMEFAVSYIEKPFDLIVSGINWGANVSYALFSSGTFAACVRGVGANVAPRGIAMSWHTPAKFWLKDHGEEDDISPYMTYPGLAALRALKLSISNEFWGKPLVNVNFPRESSNEIKVTELARDITKFYRYPVTIDHMKKLFTYPDEAFAKKEDKEMDIKLDTGAINSGFISVSPVEFGGGIDDLK